MMPAIEWCLPMPQSWRPLSLLRVDPFPAWRGEDGVSRISLPHPAADIEAVVVKFVQEHLATKQDKSTTGAVRLGDRGDLEQLVAALLWQGQANRSTQIR